MSASLAHATVHESTTRAWVAVDRRWLGRWALGLALAALGGCAAAPQRTYFDSYASYDRSFDIAVGAMADQKMVFSVQDRRHGNIVAALEGDTIVATLEPQFDGTIRVSFNAQNQPQTDPGLLTRVAGSYNARMEKLSLLGGFKDSSGTNQKSPTPCPSGPAFCP